MVPISAVIITISIEVPQRYCISIWHKLVGTLRTNPSRYYKIHNRTTRSSADRTLVYHIICRYYCITALRATSAIGDIIYCINGYNGRGFIHTSDIRYDNCAGTILFKYSGYILVTVH